MKKHFLRKLGISTCILSMILGSSAIANISENVDYNISTYQVSYTESNTDVTGETSFSTYLKLTSVDRYGKVFYDNTSSTDVTIVIKDGNNNTIKSLTIKANSKDDYDWSGIGTYTIDVRPESGSGTLKGSISVGKSDSSF